MAVTSIWRVNGWLGKVVVYVENPDKTTNPKFYTEEDMTERDGRELSDVIRYAVNTKNTAHAMTRAARKPRAKLRRLGRPGLSSAQTSRNTSPITGTIPKRDIPR